ncbi:vacuolar protein sorting-associated protein 26-domain-containing protein [Parasitella parasitica]|nr:vacuolar protein sorting-associated protein 26-domain-containing protein [Parasitella parasitica]
MDSLFGISKSLVDIDVVFHNEEQRKQAEIKVEKNRRQRYPIYLDGETVSGKIVVKLRDKKRVDHNGIKVSFIGSIDLFHESSKSYSFLNLSQDLMSTGELTQQTTTFDFEFKNVEKQYECFNGANVRLRYYVSLEISRKFSDIIREKDIWVYCYPTLPTEISTNKKMEVGIEDSLHIEFEYNKDRYHLRDVIVGRVLFYLIRIKIKMMELSIIKRETTGSTPNLYNQSENITKFEIMDGAPIKGEIIPIRLFLGGYELGPTFQDINKKFSVRYYLNLVLVDEENRRYFKQHEIFMYRK